MVQLKIPAILQPHNHRSTALQMVAFRILQPVLHLLFVLAVQQTSSTALMDFTSILGQGNVIFRRTQIALKIDEIDAIITVN